jgi:hypothetical protein
LHSGQINYKMNFLSGEVSERFKEHAWKACVLETVPWVRIPPSPMMPVPRGTKNLVKTETRLRSPAVRTYEPCQDRKVAAISRISQVFGIS